MADAHNTPSLHLPSNAHVVVVGDVLVDRWHYGTVERISPEAPVPVFVHQRSVDQPGGAGNVGANLKALGLFHTLVGSGTYAPPLKERYVVGGQQIFRADRERITRLDPMDEADWYRVATSRSTTQAMILSDYGKGMLLGDLPQKLIKWCRQFGVPSIVDPKGEDWRRYHGATVVTPNIKELGDRDPEWLMRTYDLAAVLVTKGADGMELWEAGAEKTTVIPATAREVFDVTGAGDTVVAALAYACACGYKLPDAARIANAAAGVVVGKRGTATCSHAELVKAVMLSPDLESAS